MMRLFKVTICDLEESKKLVSFEIAFCDLKRASVAHSASWRHSVNSVASSGTRICAVGTS